MQRKDYDDMDFKDMKYYTKGVFKFIGSIIYFFLKIIRKNFVLILITIVLTSVISYIASTRKNKILESRMSCVYNDNNPRIFGEMLQHIDVLLQSKSYDDLALMLSMDKDQLALLSSVQGKTLSLGKLEENYSQNKEPFYIYVKVSDQSILPVLEEKLLDYLNHNLLSQRSVKRQKEKWAARIVFYEQQLLKLDSLKDVIRQSYLIQNSNNIDLAQKDNSVVDIYKISDSMSFFLSDIKHYYNNYNSVEKIYGFKPTKPSQSLLARMFFHTLIAFVAIVLLLAAIQISKEPELEL